MKKELTITVKRKVHSKLKGESSCTHVKNKGHGLKYDNQSNMDLSANHINLEKNHGFIQRWWSQWSTLRVGRWHPINHTHLEELNLGKQWSLSSFCQCTFVYNRARRIFQVTNRIQRRLCLGIQRNARSKSKGGSPSPLLSSMEFVQLNNHNED